MEKDLQTRQIARFALSRKYEDLSDKTTDQLKKHLLDAIGSFIEASSRPAIGKLLRQILQLGEGGPCPAPGSEKNISYDRAAQLYTALIRYPDFMDNYMGKEATCHPSDNLGPILAAAQYRAASGKEVLTSMAIAYEIECRLVEEIPVMIEGIDHTLFLAYSMGGAASRLIGLTEEQTAHALGIAGCSISPMVTSRASYTYEWKGFASSMEAMNCIQIVFLAAQNMTGPIALFEGPKGFKEIFDMKLDYDWSRENFDLISHCVLKEYDAEVHSQSTIEGVIELKNKHSISPDEIEKVDITTFLTAYHIIGSGAYGDRKVVQTKEQADHSLFYLVAVALLDNQIYPEQFEPDRIKRKDVQELLQKVSVNTGFPLHKPMKVAGALDAYTRAYPDKMKTKIEITLKNGAAHSIEKEDYHGFFTRPFSWEDVIKKFRKLVDGIADTRRQDEIIEIISNLEKAADVQRLMQLITLK